MVLKNNQAFGGVMAGTSVFNQIQIKEQSP